jgi:hypothetical protein
VFRRRVRARGTAMKTYSSASSDLENQIERIRSKFHQDLENVTIGALFDYDMDHQHKPSLKVAGYPVYAYIRITPVRDRAAGAPDAVIVVDRASWLELNAGPRAALIDHELTHLERVLDKKSRQRLVDAIGRPKLRMRKHDRQFGWFDIVAERHGDQSIEVIQAKELVKGARQFYFDFDFQKVA